MRTLLCIGILIMSVKAMSRFIDHKPPVCRSLGVPPGRGSCPLTGPLPFDLIYTDYHGLQQMKQHMGLSLRKHRSVASLPLSSTSTGIRAEFLLLPTTVHECHLQSPLWWNTSASAYWLAGITGLFGLFIYFFIYFISFLLCQQNFPFEGDPIWPVFPVINQAGAL